MRKEDVLSGNVKIAEKKILDVCCGTRMFWFDKSNPDVIYMDNRRGEYSSSNGTTTNIQPDVQASFTSIPFPDKFFKMVVFDPPHRTDLGLNSWMAHQYGKLLPSWETDLKAGFDECMRVLDDYGTLIFKWNEKQIKVKKILEIFGATPLIGNKYGKREQSHWLVFMKTPKLNVSNITPDKQ